MLSFCKNVLLLRNSKFIYALLLLFALLWSVIHFPWISADGGSPSMYEYGYFVTDEGYYLGGAKEKYCFDRFVDVDRRESYAWSLSPGMSVMSWFSFRIFGQHYWAARLPFFVLNLVAWLVLLRFLSKKILPVFAFFLCLITALNPYMITYARTASTDITIGSLLVISYCVGCGRKYYMPILSGLIFGVALWIKFSVYAFIPIVCSAAFVIPAWRSRFLRLASFAGGFTAAFVFYKVGVWLCLHNDALIQNTTVKHLIKITAASYPMPNIFDFNIYPIALSVFPRYPTVGFIGCFFVLSILLSALIFLWRLFNNHLRLDHRAVLYVGVIAYAGAIAIMNTYYTHYYIPLMMLTPVILHAVQKDLRKGSNLKPKLLMVIPVLIMLGVVLSLFVKYGTLSREEIQKLVPALCNQYNLPKTSLWGIMIKPLLFSVAVCFLGGMVLLYKRFRVLSVIGLLISCLGSVSVLVAQIPALAISKVTKMYDSANANVAVMTLMLGVLFVCLMWGLPKWVSRTKIWVPSIIGCFIITTSVNPVLRKGYKDLSVRSYHHKNAGRSFAGKLPENAVVIGECVPQMFFETSIRPMSLGNSNPVARTIKYHEKYPEVPLFAVLPAGHHHMKSFIDAKDKIKLSLVATEKAPGSGSFNVIDHHLVRIFVLGK